MGPDQRSLGSWQSQVWNLAKTQRRVVPGDIKARLAKSDYKTRLDAGDSELSLRPTPVCFHSVAISSVGLQRKSKLRPR